MKLALFADVHSNLEALLAVKKDIESVKPDKTRFLGDAVGYGPNPIECIDLIKDMSNLLNRGNHDEATAFNAPFGFNEVAAKAIRWTRKTIDAHKNGKSYIEFLKNLKDSYMESQNLFVHGSPNDTISEYIMLQPKPVAITHSQALALVAPEKKRLFAAHAHHTWVYHAGLADPWQPVGNDRLTLPKDQAAVVMIGSVGQPRDGDWRACWVLLDGDTVYFRRCEYDVEKTIHKMSAIPELDERLGKRLREGM